VNAAKPAHVSVAPPAHYDVQWNRPVFRPPAITLPTPSQMWSDVPFTAQFRAKDFRTR
jgi:hypothetical protein